MPGRILIRRLPSMSSSSAIHRYVYKLGTVPGGQDVVSMNYMQNPFTALALVDIVSGAAQYGIEFTTDDIDGDPTAFRWTFLPTAPAGQNVTAPYKIEDFPVTAIRLNFGAITGEVRFTVIQSPNSTR
jgi:hypothetical protein